MVIVNRKIGYLIAITIIYLPLLILVNLCTFVFLYNSLFANRTIVDRISFLIFFSAFIPIAVLGTWSWIRAFIEGYSRIIVTNQYIMKESFGYVFFKANWEDIVEIGIDRMHLQRMRANKAYFTKGIVYAIYLSLVPTGAVAGKTGLMGLDIVDLSNEVFLTIGETQEVLDAIKEHYTDEVLILDPQYLELVKKYRTKTEENKP